VTLLPGLRGAHGLLPDHGKAVQVDPMKPTLKPPGTKRSKLRCDKLLSTSAFKFKLRRYSVEVLCNPECDNGACGRRQALFKAKVASPAYIASQAAVRPAPAPHYLFYLLFNVHRSPRRFTW